MIPFMVHTISRKRSNQSTQLNRGGIWSAGKEIPLEFALANRQNLCYPRAASSAASRSTSAITRGSWYCLVQKFVLPSPRYCSISLRSTIMRPNPRQHSSRSRQICARSKCSCLVCYWSSSPSSLKCPGPDGPGCNLPCELSNLRVVRVSCIGSLDCSLGRRFSSRRQRRIMLRMQDSALVFGSMSQSRSMSSWFSSSCLRQLSVCPDAPSRREQRGHCGALMVQAAELCWLCRWWWKWGRKYLSTNFSIDSLSILKTLQLHSFPKDPSLSHANHIPHHTSQFSILPSLMGVRYKRKLIVEMCERVRKFAESLRERHYSSAFIQHLVEAITEDPKISTLQQMYEVVQKESQMVTDFFSGEGDLGLINYRTPLCFESIRDYFHTMTRGVYKKHGSDLAKFREGLRAVARELIDIMAASTSRIVKHSELLLRDGTPKKILVYGYSRSIALSLKKLGKSLEDNLTVLACRSGNLEGGEKMVEELTVEGIKCRLIGDNEIGYFMPDVSCVLVGAQAILDNGGVLGHAGTSVVALLAHYARKPLYVFAESYKFLRRSYLCQRDIPQRFSEDRQGKQKSIVIDLTPPEHISLFCTDNGLYNPQTIAVQLAKILK